MDSNARGAIVDIEDVLVLQQFLLPVLWRPRLLSHRLCDCVNKQGTQEETCQETNETKKWLPLNFLDGLTLLFYSSLASGLTLSLALLDTRCQRLCASLHH